jgi:hypothetical protein
MTSPKAKIVLLLQEAMTHLIEKTTQTKQWKMDQDGNEGLSLDFRHGLEQYQDKLQLLKMVGTEQQLEIQVTIGPAIHSWEDVRGAVYHLLGLVAEQLLMVAQDRDEETYQFWFVTGDLTHLAPHGHFGVISIPLEDVKHLDPDEYE